jgi:hypothetical protein
MASCSCPEQRLYRIRGGKIVEAKEGSSGREEEVERQERHPHAHMCELLFLILASWN